MTAATQIVVSLESLFEQIDVQARLVGEVADAQERVRLQKRRLQAMADLLGVDLEKLPPRPEPKARPARPAPLPARMHAAAKPKRAKPGGWSAAILEVLERADKGLPHAAVYKALATSDFAKTVTFNLKRYYTTSSRLQKSKKVIRAGNLLYAPKVAARMEKLGPLPTRDLDEPQLFNNKIQTPNLIERVLKDNSQGLDGPALLGHLSAMEEAPESVRTHPHFIYTTLSNMIRRGTIERENGVYRLVENRNGSVAPTTDPLH